MSDVWYLFDPDHPARAEQTMQRVSVAGRKLVIERGTFGAWQVIREKRVLTPDAIEDRLADARAGGLVVERDPFAVLERLSARHPELEAVIDAIDDLDSAAGSEALEVYADFLQSQGDARGELAGLQLRDRYGSAAREWVANHRAQVFGPVAEGSWLPRLHWRGGWIVGVDVLGSPDAAERVADLVRLPACACLRSLRGAWPIVRAGLPHCRATVRRVFIERLRDEDLQLGELPKLDEIVLRLRGGLPRGLTFSSARTPKLFVAAGTLAEIEALLDTVALEWLERFGFWIPWQESRPEQLRALLGHPALQSLRELAPVWMTTDEGPEPLEGPLLEALLEAPLLRRVELRDLSELEVADPQRVLDAFADAPGVTKVCPATRP